MECSVGAKSGSTTADSAELERRKLDTSGDSDPSISMGLDRLLRERERERLEQLEEFRLDGRFKEERESRLPNLVRSGDAGREIGIKSEGSGRKGDSGRGPGIF